MNDNVVPFPPPSEEDRGEVIMEKIIEVLEDESDNSVAFNAAMSTVVYCLTRVCPTCRRNAAKAIKKALPEMLRKADEIAKEDKGACH